VLLLDEITNQDVQQKIFRFTLFIIQSYQVNSYKKKYSVVLIIPPGAVVHSEDNHNKSNLMIDEQIKIINPGLD